MNDPRRSGTARICQICAAGSFVAVTQLATVAQPDIPQKLATAGLAVCLPILSILWFMDFQTQRGRKTAHCFILLFFISLSAVFYHFSTRIGLASSASLAVAYLILRLEFDPRLRKGNCLRWIKEK